MVDKDTDIEIFTVPNDKYKKFFDKFAEIETLDVAPWKVPISWGISARNI